MKTILNRRNRSPRRHRTAERGVALVLVMIFLALMLLLGLATTMTSITEVNVGSNYRLSTDVFDVADAGAAHGFELVRNMRGDFTYVLRGEDGILRSGDEFKNSNAVRTFKPDGSLLEYLPGVDNYKTDKVLPIGKTPGTDGFGRALHQIDARRFYELIAYDNANDTRSWLVNSQNEVDNDPSDSATTDCDQRILIRSIGYIMAEDTTKDNFLPGNAIASAVVDIVVGLTPYPAIITQNDLTVQNGVEIRGTLGAVHANDNLTLGGGSWVIEQSATFANTDPTDSASGANQTADNANVGGFNGPAGELYIPDINPFDTRAEAQYLRKEADYIVISHVAGANERQALVTALGGNAATALEDYMAAGDTVFLSNDRVLGNPTYTVEHVDSGQEEWTFGSGATALTIDVANDGSATVDDIPTAPAPGPWVRGKGVFVLLPEGINKDIHLNVADGQISLMTNGSVHMNGNARIKPGIRIAPPEAPPWNQIDLLVLAGEDLWMNGTAGAGDVLEGVMYCHEQFDLTGSGYITGQVVGYDRDLVYDPTTLNYKSNVITVLTNPFGSGGNTSVVTSSSTVRGNFEVNHSASNGYIGNFAQAAWRQLRDFDPVANARIVP
jgi:hypothetical protein